MTYELRFLPEVEDDAIAGYLWYEGKSSLFEQAVFLRYANQFKGKLTHFSATRQ